ncbi:MAG: hypothetical protein JOY73_03370 [Actinobacteria bacterium]|nr:hypothetical protein [Actinomycetota bacterium]
MRFLAVAGAALVLAAPAAAASWPPPGTQSIRSVTIAKQGQLRSDVRACMANDARAKLARFLFPVACEQPPRSQQLLVSSELLGG